MQKMKLRLDTGLRAYYHLKKILPQDRLQVEEEKFEKNYGNNLDFHPFIKLLHDAKKDYDEYSKSNTITNNVAKLIVLELDIEILLGKKVKGIDKKIEELITSGYQKSDDVIYELRIASYLINCGHNVEFIEENLKEKRPDLLINNEIQLDCKNKDLLVKLDNFDYEYFSKEWTIILDKLTSKQKYVLLYVHFKNVDKVEQTLAESVKNKILELIETDNIGKFEHNGVDIHIYPICKNKQDVINTDLSYLEWEKMSGINTIIDRLDIAFRKKLGDKEFNDILRRGINFFDHRIGVTNINGNTGLKEIRAILCATKKLPERFSSISDSIRYANNQMNKRIPAIVSIRITDLMTGMFPFDFQQAAVISHVVLQENTKISVALFTSEEFDENSKVYKFGVQMMKNDNAEFRLPTKYDDLMSL